MNILQKLLNFKSTVKYHKFRVEYDLVLIQIRLLIVKYIFRKNPKIIVLTEHIGDVLAFSAVAQYFKNQNPQNYIIWCINSRYIDVIQYNMAIDYAWPIYCDAVIHRAKKWSKYEFVDVRFNNNNYCNLCPSDKMYQQIDSNFNLENYYNYGSLLEIFAKIAGINPQDIDPNVNLEIPKEIESSLKAKYLNGSKYICIHTESNDPEREWDLGLWQKLIEKILQTTDYQIIIVGLKKQIPISSNRTTDLSGQLSLIETATVIKNASYFIGIDSGMAHFANVFDIKATVILGKFRNMEKYMPYAGFFAENSNANIIFDKNITCKDVKFESAWTALIKHKIVNE